MLGSELRDALGRARLPFVGSDRDVDILDPAALAAFAREKGAENGINAIVNCAAYTAVDRAEDEPELCRRLNVDGPENLGRVAAERGARIIHISTDYVFDGTATAPYRESDPVAPLGTYGRTKAEGEASLLAVAPGAVIIRTAWLYGAQGPNFVYTMLRLMRAKERIGVVADQRGSPTWAHDLAAALATILGASETKPGIYHFTNEGETNWHEFALEIHRLGREYGILERDCAIDALTTDQYPTKTKRPAYSILSKAKIAATFGIRPPEWRESLAHFFEDNANCKHPMFSIL
jgi:dTDP-4-dehydrorhamnose reductase